ncbi:hypothetical protein [Stutzerimonas nitrititolerans]|uniref:hypothetical protein n=1 Tax=Stutzerimonas nitrititolerans TaxID=2482751 RepID=UPI0028A114E0|nr:hypothetical protein [Stutzerimonas nitrititolerans]
MSANIVKGTFAIVSRGNCSTGWLTDGADIQDRANAAISSYWGSTAAVHERGIKGYGIQVEGCRYIVEVYATLEAAERHMDRAGMRK